MVRSSDIGPVYTEMHPILVIGNSDHRPTASENLNDPRST
jgi:hypothetical protein